MVKITQKNDAKITVNITAISGDVILPVDLRGVDDIRVSIPSAPQDAYTWTVDELGRLVIDVDSPKFAIRAYSLIVTGTVQGRDWCYTQKEFFEVVRWTADSNVPSVAVSQQPEIVIVEITVPPIGYGGTTLSATVLDIDEYDTLAEKDEHTLYVVTQDVVL